MAVVCRLSADRCSQIASLRRACYRCSLWRCQRSTASAKSLKPRQAHIFSTLSLIPQIAADDITQRQIEYSVPMFLLQGRDDAHTSTELAREYFDRLHAPRKDIVVIEGGDYIMHVRMPQRFCRS